MSEISHFESSYQAFVDASQPNGVDLANISRLGLEKLLESNPILGCFASSDTDTIGLKGLPNCGMTKDIIWVRWLLDEDRFELNQVLHVLDGLRDAPDLAPAFVRNIPRVALYQLTWFASIII